VQPLEHAEQLVRVPHVETDAVVAHEHHGFAGLAPVRPDFDPRHRPPARVFQRVRDQIDEDLAQQRRIAVDLREQLHRPGDRSAGLRADVLLRLPQHLVEADALPRDRFAAHPRECEQVVDESSHADGRVADRPEAPTLLVVQLVERRALDQRDEAGNVPERCPQIVRDRVAEGFQLLIHVGQLALALAELGLAGPQQAVGVANPAR
jgi:hypothetical protein